MLLKIGNTIVSSNPALGRSPYKPGDPEYPLFIGSGNKFIWDARVFVYSDDIFVMKPGVSDPVGLWKTVSIPVSYSIIARGAVLFLASDRGVIYNYPSPNVIRWTNNALSQDKFADPTQPNDSYRPDFYSNSVSFAAGDFLTTPVGTDISGTIIVGTTTGFYAAEANFSAGDDLNIFCYNLKTTIDGNEIAGDLLFVSLYDTVLTDAKINSIREIMVSAGVVQKFPDAIPECFRNCNLTSFRDSEFGNCTDLSYAWADNNIVDFAAGLFDSCVCTNYDGTWYGNALSAQSIENIFVSISKSADANGLDNGVIGIDGGTNSEFKDWTKSAKMAYWNLQSRGWTINCNLTPNLIAWFEKDTGMYKSDGTLVSDGDAIAVWRDSGGGGNDAFVNTGEEPIYSGGYADFTGSKRMIVNFPSAFQGTVVIGGEEGIFSYDVDQPAGDDYFDVYGLLGNAYLDWHLNDGKCGHIAVFDRILTDDEVSRVENFFESKGDSRKFTGGPDFQTSIASRHNMTKIRSYLDTSDGTNFYAFIYDNKKITEFPFIDVSNCIDATVPNAFSRFAQGNSSMTYFPPNMFDDCQVTNYRYAFSICSLTAQSIENAIVSILKSAQTYNLRDGLLDFDGGTNADFLTWSPVARNALYNLEARGWTVNCNNSTVFRNAVLALDYSYFKQSSGRLTQWYNISKNANKISDPTSIFGKRPYISNDEIVFDNADLIETPGFIEGNTYTIVYGGSLCTYSAECVATNEIQMGGTLFTDDLGRISKPKYIAVFEGTLTDAEKDAIKQKFIEDGCADKFSSDSRWMFSRYGCPLSIIKFDEADLSEAVNCTSAWKNNDMTSFPAIDFSKCETFVHAWIYNNFTSFPQIDVSKGTDFNSAWRENPSLSDFPAAMFDTNDCISYTDAWFGCSLIAQSIENILVSIDNAGESYGTIGVDGGTNTERANWTANAENAAQSLESRGWIINSN